MSVQSQSLVEFCESNKNCITGLIDLGFNYTFCNGDIKIYFYTNNVNTTAEILSKIIINKHKYFDKNLICSLLETFTFRVKFDYDKCQYIINQNVGVLSPCNDLIGNIAIKINEHDINMFVLNISEMVESRSKIL